MTWIETQPGVHYVLELARNARLQALLAPEFENVRVAHAAACELARREGREEPRSSRGFAEFQYRTKDSWSRARRVIGKAEVTGDKDNPRFMVRTEDIGNKLTGNIGYTLSWAHALEQCVTNGTKTEICQW